MANQGAKRKRVYESSDSEPPETTDMEIISKTKQIIKRVTDNNTIHTNITHEGIISKIKKMNTVNKKKQTIGIFGKSGEGKSYLLSAVLGKQNLLPSGCFGACTAVITQVEANLTDSNYTAEIELFSKEEWEKELSKLLTILSDENADSNEEFEIAHEKIIALYGADAGKKTLEELKNDDKYTEIKKHLSSNEETQKISKSDVSEFADIVARYIQNSEACSGAWYWPLVKSVTIKIPDCNELLKHIVLVDIPGTGDCNKIRDELWKTKLRECSSVWIISNISRAITDKDPWGILKHCIEELGPGGECKHISFICTKTDEIDPVGFMRSARLTRDANCSEKEQKKMCISKRNELAKRTVAEKFEKSEIKKRFNTDDDFFQVFTVSSKAFFDTSLDLDSTKTEIPKLQDDLRSLNKSISQELTREYVNEAKGVLSLIQSVQLDKDKKAAEMKNSIHTEFSNNLIQALSKLDNYFDSVYKIFEPSLSKGVEESVKSCVDSTKEFLTPITAYNTLEAVCRKGGRHISKNMDTVLDLNKLLAKHLHQYIDDDFRQIFPVSGITGQSVQEQIDKFTIIQTDTAYSRYPICHYIHDYIKTEEVSLIKSLKTDIVNIKKEIYSSIHKTIENEMAICYRDAASLKGPGCLNRMKNLLQNTVDEIKNDMFNKAKMEMLQKCTDLKLHIKARLETGLKKAMDNSPSKTSKNESMDVSKEIEELEGLLEQLSD